MLRLDALAMRIGLDLAARQDNDAANHARELARIWERLKLRIPESARVVRDAFSGEVANLRTAVDARRNDAVVKSARAIEELVDQLEAVFPE